MCDTICSLPSWSQRGCTLFAKNTDRPSNEAHHVLWQPAATHSKRSNVKCTYIEIPQKSYTHAIMMYKPAWCWGCEMGVNDHGVAVGNEAVFTNAKYGSTALIGMDFVRLALERADSAIEAVDVITQLLEQYGQGGQCGLESELFYNNSFLIADPRNAYVLETSGKKWVARPVLDYDALSNELCRHTDHTMRGGISEDFDFAGILKDPLLSRITGARMRRKVLLRVLKSPPTTYDMMEVLRLHHIYGDNGKQTKFSICMHPEESGFNTAGSLVAVLRENSPCTLWTTGSSLPCLSMFKPIFLGSTVQPTVFVEPAQTNAYWIKHETLNRSLSKIDLKSYIEQRDSLEQKWLQDETEIMAHKVNADILAEFTRKTMEQEEILIRQYIF